MILSVADLIRAHAPGALPNTSISVAYVRTTCPKYLLFATDASRPICVAQFGDPTSLARVHAVLTRLYKQRANLVPESRPPIQLAAQALHLQGGLPGLPWFRLKAQVRTTEHWYDLARKAVEALSSFDEAVASYADWRCSVKPGLLLDQAFQLARSRGVAFSLEASLWIETKIRLLETVGTVESQYQHGDFCLNNLLIGDQASIIDFDEFGGTSMPLNDWIGLDLSLRELRFRPDTREAHRIRRSVAHPDLRSHALIPGLLVHYLLWRINQAHACATREHARRALITNVEETVRKTDAEIVSEMYLL